MADAEKVTAVRLPRCARCQVPHIGLTFIPFELHPVQVGDQTYTHFAICPELGEPILMHVTNIETIPAEKI